MQDLFIGWTEALESLGQKVIRYRLDERIAFFGHLMMRRSDRPNWPDGEDDDPDSEYVAALSVEQAYEMAANGLYSTLYQSMPDVLLVISGFFVPGRMLDLARRTRTRIVIVHTESPYEDQRQITLAQHGDLNLINDPTNINDFPNARYLPHAYRPKVHHPGPSVPELECDLAFVGTAYPSRIGFFEAMDLDGLDVKLAGNWDHLPESSPLMRYVINDPKDCLDNTDAADLYRSARLGINTYRVEAEKPELSAGWSMSPREVEMAACGLMFLRQSRPEGDAVLDMLPTFESPQEASALVREWLNRPDERQRVALKAREAIADRTFDHHAALVLAALDS